MAVKNINNKNEFNLLIFSTVKPFVYFINNLCGKIKTSYFKMQIRKSDLHFKHYQPASFFHCKSENETETIQTKNGFFVNEFLFLPPIL